MGDVTHELEAPAGRTQPHVDEHHHTLSGLDEVLRIEAGLAPSTRRELAQTANARVTLKWPGHENATYERLQFDRWIAEFQHIAVVPGLVATLEQLDPVAGHARCSIPTWVPTRLGEIAKRSQNGALAWARDRSYVEPNEAVA